jgi:predicted secreted hydrolase
VENVYSRIRQIFNHYTEQGEQQRNQAYEQLKTQFATRMQQAAQQQFGTAVRMRNDFERHPQFQEEWRKALTQLDSPYLQNLAEYRSELQSIP